MISFNGDWMFKIDPENQGQELGWNIEMPSNTSVIKVPSLWNEALEPEYSDGYAWYFKKVNMEPKENKCYLLYFGAVNISCDVWLNGEHTGCHEGGYTPFVMDITEKVRQGENYLAIRVGHELTGNAVAKETWYYKYAGIWQDVVLMEKDAVYAESCSVRTQIDGTVEVVMEIVNKTSDGRRLSVNGVIIPSSSNMAKSEYSGEFDLAPGTNCMTFKMHVDDTELWGVDSPNLYNLNVEFQDNQGLGDIISIRFGFREFKIENNRFKLNGSEIILKGVLYQPNHAETYIYPESREAAYREVRMVKEAGFNLIRAHIKPAHPWTLDAADELGVLVYEEPAIGWMSLPAAEDAAVHGMTPEELLYQRAKTEALGMIKRDINRPCIIMWGVLNEGGYKAWDTRKQLAEEIRKLDPTRVIIDDSPIGAGERLLWNPYENEPQVHWSSHPYRPCPINNDDFNHYMEFGFDDNLSFVSEFGFGGFNLLSEVVAEYERRGLDLRRPDYRQYSLLLSQLYEKFYGYKLDEVFDDVNHLIEASQKLQAEEACMQAAALRINPKISGYIFTQWNDAGFEMTAGLVDPWRNPKKAFHAFKAVNDPLCLVVRPRNYSYYFGSPLDIAAYIVNENKEYSEKIVNFRLRRERQILQELSIKCQAGWKRYTNAPRGR